MIVSTALLLGIVACSNEQRVGKSWLRDPSAPHFNRTPENEVHSFWRVVPGKTDEAIDALKNTSVVSISPDDAPGLLARVPIVQPGKSLFLIRGIDVDTRPIPIRVFESKGVLDVSAGTFETCFLIKPSVRPQPLIVALSQAPSRVMIGYSCDGP